MNNIKVDFYTNVTYTIDSVTYDALDRKEIIKREVYFEGGREFARLSVVENYETVEDAQKRIKELYRQEGKKKHE